MSVLHPSVAAILEHFTFDHLPAELQTVKAVAAALRRQPVRAYLYGVLIPGEALAVSYGLLSDNEGALWLALGAAVLVVPGIEVARAKVTPVADPRDNTGDRLWSFRELPPRRTGRHGAMPPLYDFRTRPPGP